MSNRSEVSSGLFATYHVRDIRADASFWKRQVFLSANRCAGCRESTDLKDHVQLAPAFQGVLRQSRFLLEREEGRGSWPSRRHRDLR